MNKTILLTAAAIISISATLFLGCSGDKKPETKTNTEMIDQNKNQSDIVREKGFNVTSIDKNENGNVYQCPMDYEVISDEPDKCPKCGMKLEEVSIEKAQHDFDKYME